MTQKMPTPLFRCTLAGTGEVVEVQSTHADAVRFDLARPRLNWPTMKEAPMLWATFLAWHALRREMKAGKRPPIVPFPDDAAGALDLFDVLDFVKEDGETVTADSDPEDIGVSPTTATA